MKTVHLLMRKPPNETEHITQVQGRVLRLLWRRLNEDTYQKDVEKTFGITRSTASSLLSRMEKDGLLTRNDVPFDARLKKLALTEKGLAICHRNQDNIEETERKLQENISPEDLETLRRVLAQMRSNLGCCETESCK